ncbi:MAG TPA: HEAT repeat domain-containing protein [Gammaproteobacteria bacterium]|nr:HEAT repeat domain-containing protein [Gammaproteobacteria bacterium]
MTTTPPDALLLLTRQCPYCPTVLETLAGLLKQGLIGRLEAVDIESHPDRAAEFGVRSVPWTRIGPFALEGLQSPEALKHWAQQAVRPEGLAEYLATELREGRLGKLTHELRRQPAWLDTLLEMAADPEAELTVRIGISALLEDIAGSEMLGQRLDSLLRLSHHPDPRVRAEACHYLALSARPEARRRLEEMRQDPAPTVRDMVQDVLEDWPV